MPHIHIDYTTNLEDTVTREKLMDSVHQDTVDSEIPPSGAYTHLPNL